MSLTEVFRKLFRTANRLSTLENLILDNVRYQLSDSVQSKWDAQIGAINKVQRLPDGVEVDFYRIKDGHPSFDVDLAFPNDAEELLIARVQVGLPHVAIRLVANIWCVKGFLFSIEYEGGASYFEEAAGEEPIPGFIFNTEIIADISK